MMLISLLLLAAPLAADATTLLRVPLSSKLLPNKLAGSVLRRRSDTGAPIQNAVLKVVTPVQAGNNQKFADMLVDTGSAILWVGGEQAYQPGPHTQTTNSTFSVGYGIGGVNGTVFRDRVIIGEAQGNAQIIGAAGFTEGFTLVDPIDGILGLGPSGSNAGEVTGFNSTPTFVETLLADHKIENAIFGIFISPLATNGVPEGTGEITFGGLDTSRIKGDVTWISQRPPVNFHWEFNMSVFTFGQVTLSEPTFSRTDTGLLSISIPADQFFAIRDAYNATSNFDDSALSGFLAFPSNATDALPPLTFTISHTTFSIPPSRYLVPRSLYPSLNITNDPTLAYTWIASGGFGEFGLGQNWLQNFYTAYDMENHRIGFAHLA